MKSLLTMLKEKQPDYEIQSLTDSLIIETANQFLEQFKTPDTLTNVDKNALLNSIMEKVYR